MARVVNGSAVGPASTHPKIEQLSVISRPDGTDIVYLSAPFTSTLAGELYLGTVPRGAQT
jgi:hypothetical protein